MKCYYEELGVAHDASDGDIKTAYKKLALNWHPDKNLNNSEEAKEKFQTLQQAYEVLSDQHERAWYDNHREQILRGKNSEYKENCLDLFQYFTDSCFKGYGDDDKGFYKTYAEVFKKITAEDAEFMDDAEEIENIPKFGDSTSSYVDVVGPFYAYWQCYSTKKNYTWLCPHDTTGINDPSELKKIVQQAKSERNEEVRNLVWFIRKRDTRVQANKKLLEEKAAVNRQKQEQNRLEQIIDSDGDFARELDSKEKSDNSHTDQDEKAFEHHKTSQNHKENTQRIEQEIKDSKYFDRLDIMDALNELDCDNSHDHDLADAVDELDCYDSHDYDLEDVLNELDCDDSHDHDLVDAVNELDCYDSHDHDLEDAVNELDCYDSHDHDLEDAFNELDCYDSHDYNLEDAFNELDCDYTNDWIDDDY